jgi:DNA-binding transcriptional ArsR family regulator
MSKYYNRIDFDYYELDGFNRFMATREASILLFLIRHILRNPEQIKAINADMRKDFIKFVDEGKLVARYPQERLAEIYDVTQSSISRNLKKLNEYGFIKIIRKRIGKHKEMVCYYELGTFTSDDKDKKTDELYFDKLWSKSLEDSKKVKAKYPMMQ